MQAVVFLSIKKENPLCSFDFFFLLLLRLMPYAPSIILGKLSLEETLLNLGF